MGTVPMGTGELRMIHSRVVWMSGPVERSITVSAPQRVAQVSFSTSSAIEEVTAELPMLALTLTRKRRPMTIGSDSGWLTLAGMMARPAATSSRTTSAGHPLAGGHELHLRGDLARPGVVQLRHRGPGRAQRRRRPGGGNTAASGRCPAHRGPAVVAPCGRPALVLLDVTPPVIHGRRSGGRPDGGIGAGSRGVVEPDRRVGHRSRRGPGESDRVTSTNGTRIPSARPRRPSGRCGPAGPAATRWSARRSSGASVVVDSVMAYDPFELLSTPSLPRSASSRGSRIVPSWAPATRGSAVPTGAPPTPHERMPQHGKTRPGDKAPAFTLPDQDGKKVSLRDFAGHPVVVYFYPGDDTPGCTKEACQFNDNLRAFSRAKVAVLGISADSADKHRKFRTKYGLNFPLLTDADHTVGEAYGAWGEKTLYGKKSMGVIRSTFLVGADGKVARAWYHVKADGHAAKVLAELERLSPAVDPRGQCWWRGHHQVVRPPTVERASSAPSRGSGRRGPARP